MKEVPYQKFASKAQEHIGSEGDGEGGYHYYLVNNRHEDEWFADLIHYIEDNDIPFAHDNSDDLDHLDTILRSIEDVPDGNDVYDDMHDSVDTMVHLYAADLLKWIGRDLRRVEYLVDGVHEVATCGGSIMALEALKLAQYKYFTGLHEAVLDYFEATADEVDV